ncbi:BREX-1 system adenine-specific DNA-methyltransferase PglX [Stutzerimonas stutzeri]|uniref:BREX-1 system adenine-specific DNA-methyltransferase PglX n=1 Tax=Stutzerimonas stutzeri TaxID=316 RepID=UPI00210C3523|nr:BREX-1 system adenine-specific DNA-methyltransferase PglX [Stutzerimonas stutzeri]
MSRQDTKNMGPYFYRASAADFIKIPGSPIAYWASKKAIEIFSNEMKLGDISAPRQGLATSDDQKFLRCWHEVSKTRCALRTLEADHSSRTSKKWIPFVKGGAKRRWYGNNELLINWLNDGEEVKQYAESLYGSVSRTIKNMGFYFKGMIAWSLISGGGPSFRLQDEGQIFGHKGPGLFSTSNFSLEDAIAFLNSKVSSYLLSFTSPTLSFEVGAIQSLPVLSDMPRSFSSGLVSIASSDWDAYETSWDFTNFPLLHSEHSQPTLKASYQKLRAHWCEITLEMQRLEEENNRIFIDAYGLQGELTPEVQLNEITLTCNPHYRYGGDKSEAELEILQQCDTIEELVSYAIGCMMGRYSLDKPGLILASQGDTLQDYLRQIPAPRFTPDHDAILPLTDQEWFADDATQRFREFIRVVWGDEQLQQNLDFVAESLCLHAIKPKRGEASLDTIRRYLSTQFFKDHLRTYKKRPIYWLFSSGKHKAFECLVYLHRYNEGTLARMRTEYVIPLTAKLSTYAAKLEKDVEASTSTAEKKRLENELTALHNQQAELATFDEKLRHYADQRISLDLDDGVKVNYGKFGDLLAEVKAVTGGAADD